MVVGLFAGGTLVTAENVAAATQPNAKTGPTTQKPARPTQLSTAAIDQLKEADYNAARAKAQTDYKNAKAKCRKRSRKAIPGCMTEAKAVRDEALAQAKVRWGTQQESR
ncbi:MAG TPA: hypothetical protein VKD04_07460 [Burkholderiales bacterium]|nr:hypothetical protein [Burkholderiales bacterium]